MSSIKRKGSLNSYQTNPILPAKISPANKEGSVAEVSFIAQRSEEYVFTFKF